MSNIYIWPLDRILLGAITPSYSGPRSNANEGILNILQSSSITGGYNIKLFDVISGHSFVVGSNPGAKMQSVYATTLIV